MTTFIAAGSNLNNRLKNLTSALNRLQQNDLFVQDVSPVYETPAALLYETAKDEWNRPYLNCIFKIETKIDAFTLLKRLKRIESDMGRNAHERWSPRVIDLDIIEHNNERIDTPELTVPHKLCLERSFVLDPLSFFKNIPADKLYTQAHQPSVMGILNVTPDSFSDGGLNNDFENFKTRFEQWAACPVGFIDIGAESTRPGAKALDTAEEIIRLQKVFTFTKALKKNPFSPRLSIDSYHVQTVEKALENGFNVINDIQGLSNPDMLSLAKEHKDKICIFMHGENIIHLPFKQTLTAVEQWLEKRIETFSKNGLNLNQMIFDPGIGFGKTAGQSLLLLQNIEVFHKYGVRLLVGHSRKSFMKTFTDKPSAQRDVETLAISLKIANKVDLLRVHTPLEHQEALLAATHLENQFF